MEWTDYHLIFNLIPDEWSTAKQLGLAAATLNAMERRGLIEVNRACSPMKYKPIVRKGSKDIILNMIKDFDESYRVHLVYEVGCIETIIKQSNGTWQCYFNKGMEINDSVCSHVKYLSIYRNGEGLGCPDVKYENN